MRAPAPAKSAVDRAVNLLARRALSVRELGARLARHGHGEAESAAAIARMREYGYVNDARLAVSVAAEAARAGRGPLWIRATLQRRGLPLTPDPDALRDACAAAAVAPDAGPDAAAEDPAAHLGLAAARRQLERRFGTLPPADARTYGRAYRFLCRRGFTHDRVRELLGDGAREASACP